MTQTIIMVVDQTDSDSFLVVEASTGLNTRVVAVQSALDAVHYMARHEVPNAVLLNPENIIFGSSLFIGFMRRHVRYRNVPIALWSEHEDTELAERLAVGTLSKLMPQTELRQRLTWLLSLPGGAFGA